MMFDMPKEQSEEFRESS